MGRLHELCRKSNDTTALCPLLQSGSSVDEPDATGGAPLHYAARYGNTAIVVALLDANASINPTNKKSQTPLYHAVVGQYSDIVKILLEHGADPNVQTAAGYFALHFAAREGLLGITKSLLSNKAEPEAKTAEGMTPHALAVKYNQTTAAAIIQQFIETGTYEGVDDIELNAEDEDDAELMRELSDMEIQPTMGISGGFSEMRPPAKASGGCSTASPPKPGPAVAPSKDDDVDGFGKVYVGSAPPPHLLKKVGTSAATYKAPSKDDDVDGFGKVHVGSAPPPHLLKKVGASAATYKEPDEVTYTPGLGDAVEPRPEMPEYAVPDKGKKVVEPQQTYDTYNGAMGADDVEGMQAYDNAEAGTDLVSADSKVVYNAPQMYDSAPNSGDSPYAVPADNDPDYASVDELKASPSPVGNLASFLRNLGLQDKCAALAEDAGIDAPEDFKLFSEQELTSEHNFKVGHIRKILKALA